MRANPRYDRLRDALASCDRVLLTGPTEPDGDSLGACLALQRVLRRRGVEVDVTGAPAFRYTWLPGAPDIVADGSLRPDYDAVVVLDGDRHRLTPGAERAFAAASVKGIVDHHASTTEDGYTHCWVEPTATSTCEMLYDALVGSGEALDPELATLLYVGAIFDTGGFRYSNTTPATHRMAAHLLEIGIDHTAITTRVLMERREAGMRLAGRVFCDAERALDGRLVIGAASARLLASLGADTGDLEGLVDALVYVEGTEVAVLLTERGPDKVKASLRSRGRVNVARVARELSTAGGGHAKAAGALIDGSLDHARAQVIEEVGKALEGCTRAA